MQQPPPKTAPTSAPNQGDENLFAVTGTRTAAVAEEADPISICPLFEAAPSAGGAPPWPLSWRAPWLSAATVLKRRRAGFAATATLAAALVGGLGFALAVPRGDKQNPDRHSLGSDRPVPERVTAGARPGATAPPVRRRRARSQRPKPHHHKRRQPSRPAAARAVKPAPLVRVAPPVAPVPAPRQAPAPVAPPTPSIPNPPNARPLPVPVGAPPEFL